MDTLSLGLFILVNHHYNYHYHYQHQYHGHNCPLVTSSFINILFKDRSCSLSSKSQSANIITNHHDHRYNQDYHHRYNHDHGQDAEPSGQLV